MTKAKQLFKENKEEILLGGTVGGLFYFISNKISPNEFSVLQSSLSDDKIAKTVSAVGVSLDIQQLLFFIIMGMLIAIIVSKFIVKFK